MGLPYNIPDWQAAAAEKRQGLHASIPKSYLLPADLSSKVQRDEVLPSDESVLSCGVLTPLDLEITSIDDAAVLVDSIAFRRYTAVQVTEAFCRRASTAQQTTNCLTEILYGSALERARSLDEYMEKEGRPVGMLHGLPVSLKDCFNIKGVPTTAGLASWIPNIAPDDSSVVKALVSAGAVPYVKTNVSQALLTVESINNVFGTTKNPYNLALSAGGSSGGEAALVAAQGSVLGTGTDGGGSIRFPAGFCGLWGLKCSKGRIPTTGIMAPNDGNESVNMGVGPMARSVASLELWLKAQLHPNPWDSDISCVPMPWDATWAERPNKRLVIGVIRDDGVVHPTPPVSRAMRETVSLLVNAGHRVIDLPASEVMQLHRRATSCVMKSNVQSGGHSVMEHINASGEPVVPRIATGSPASFLSTPEVCANHLVRANIAEEYNSLWARFGLDAILVPAVAHPAPPHGKYVSNSYATIYNMLDYAVGSVPVTKVDLQRDVAPKEWYERESYSRIEREKFPYDWGDEEMKGLYTGPDVYRDSPVGVQIVCRRLREEKLVGILKEVEVLLGASTAKSTSIRN